MRRWSAMLGCTAARSYALFLLDKVPAGVDGSSPSANEVLRDDRLAGQLLVTVCCCELCFQPSLSKKKHMPTSLSQCSLTCLQELRHLWQHKRSCKKLLPSCVGTTHYCWIRPSASSATSLAPHWFQHRSWMSRTISPFGCRQLTLKAGHVEKFRASRVCCSTWK